MWGDNVILTLPNVACASLLRFRNPKVYLLDAVDVPFSLLVDGNQSCVCLPLNES